MNMVTTVTIAAFAAVALMASGASAINCWECSGFRDCNDDVVTSNVGVTEQTNCEYCVKTKTYYLGAHTVSRSCWASTSSYVPEEMSCFDTEDEDGNEMERCYCNGNLCNGSSRAGLSVLPLLAAMVLGRLF